MTTRRARIKTWFKDYAGVPLLAGFGTASFGLLTGLQTIGMNAELSAVIAIMPSAIIAPAAISDIHAKLKEKSMEIGAPSVFEPAQTPKPYREWARKGMAMVKPFVKELYGNEIEMPNLSFSHRRTTSGKLDYAGEYLKETNTIMLYNYFYEHYKIHDGKKFTDWSIMGFAHELAHAHIDHYPKRKIRAVSPTAEGLAELSGNYAFKKVSGLPTDRYNVAYSTLLGALKKVEWYGKNLAEARELAAHGDLNSRTQAYLDMDHYLNSTNNYVESVVNLSRKLIRGKEQDVAGFIRGELAHKNRYAHVKVADGRSTIKKIRDVFAAVSGELHNVHIEWQLRSGLPKLQKRVAALRSEAIALIEEVKKKIDVNISQK